jgi:hypothetical protein
MQIVIHALEHLVQVFFTDIKNRTAVIKRKFVFRSFGPSEPLRTLPKGKIFKLKSKNCCLRISKNDQV